MVSSSTVIRTATATTATSTTPTWSHNSNAFLVLDDCDVFVECRRKSIFNRDRVVAATTATATTPDGASSNKNGNKNTGDCGVSGGGWFDITIPSPSSPSSSHDTATATATATATETCCDASRDTMCSNCCLILSLDTTNTNTSNDTNTNTNNNTMLKFHGEEPPRYDGTIHDIKCTTTTTIHPKKKNPNNPNPNNNNNNIMSHCGSGSSCGTKTTSRSSSGSVRDGTDTSGTNTNTSPRSSSSRKQQQQQSHSQRSDAALLVGLAITTQEMGHIQIDSIKICLFVPTTKINEHDSDDNDKGRIMNRNRNSSSIGYQKWKACILIACTCREQIVPSPPLRSIRHDRQHHQQQQQQQQQQRRRFFTTSTHRLLPAATQLLLALLHSDWSLYDDIVRRCKEQEEEKRRRTRTKMKTVLPGVSFFPNQLSLENVYERINTTTTSSSSSSTGGSRRALLTAASSVGSGGRGEGGEKIVSVVTHDDNYYNNPNKTTTTRTRIRTIQLLQELPVEILCDQIGTYLQARSLENLRCTCTHFYYNNNNNKSTNTVNNNISNKSLCSIVPGLKLQLYTHQIQSLIWMRQREQKQQQQQPTPGGGYGCGCGYGTNTNTSETDFLRAVTGGGSTLLRARYKHHHHHHHQKQKEDDNKKEKEEHGKTITQEAAAAAAAAARTMIRISQFDGVEIKNRQEQQLSRNIARGGLLCDDPGLGKTITVLSLILQTMGLSTESKNNQEQQQQETANDNGGNDNIENDANQVTIANEANVNQIVDTESTSTQHNRSLIHEENVLVATDALGCKSLRVNIANHHYLLTAMSPRQLLSASSRQLLLEGSEKESRLSPAEELIFYQYWKEQITVEFQCMALTKLFSAFLRSSSDINLFYDKVIDTTMDEEESDVSSTVVPAKTKNIFSLKEIRQRINTNIYEDSFTAFETDVELCLRISTTNPSSINRYLNNMAALRLQFSFRRRVDDYKKEQLVVATKSFSRASAKPNSIVAALIEKCHRDKLKNSLRTSSGTLLVVPVTVLDHWMDQIRLHVDSSYITEKIPLVYEYKGSTRTEEMMKDIVKKCKLNKTHFPFIFVDKVPAKELPPPDFLAMFAVVITTCNRFSLEWKNGSFDDEIRRKSKHERKGNTRTRTNEFVDFDQDFVTSEEACPLLKVNWLRMIVDEGHSMGRSRDNSSISFASWINAERRWAMTGTPTPQTLTQSGLSNILNLMHYLQHDFFGRRHNGDAVWNQLIVKGWSRGFVASFFRLRSLLSLLMIRHDKSDIEELLLPKFKTNTLAMGFEEVSTYNCLVSAIQSNLIITSMEGRTSGAQDSLLHKRQTKHAREALSNLRLVCSGGTQVRPTLSDQYHFEFHRDFNACNDGPVMQKKIRQFIAQATTGQLSQCDCCFVMLSTLLVFPCGHLVCTECVTNKMTSCVVCDKPFDVDAFQRLQPGFVYNWLHNIEEEKKSEHFNGDEQREDNITANAMLPGGAGVLVPYIQYHQPIRTRKFNDGHTCKYNPRSANGKCELCQKEHEPCYLLEEKRCSVCYRIAETCPLSETKISHIIARLIALQQQKAQRSVYIGKYQRDEYDTAYHSQENRILKVIIFSQFRKVLNMTGDRLLRRFGNGCVAEYWGKYRKQELNKFIKDDKCFCMILGKDGSEGLDLSFVTHIFFLEQVWDLSLERQVVARAWRMGAKGRVHIETLVAKNSIEETMLLLEEKSRQERKDDTTKGSATTDMIHKFSFVTKDKKSLEYQQAKVHYLLNSLKLIADTSTIGFGTTSYNAPACVSVNRSMEDSTRVEKKLAIKKVSFK